VNTGNLKTATTNLRQYKVSRVLQGHQRVKVLELQPISIHQKIWYGEAFYWTPGNMLALHQGDIVYQYPYADGDYFPIVQGFGGGYSHSEAS
jgi:hypothetical protein